MAKRVTLKESPARPDITPAAASSPRPYAGTRGMLTLSDDDWRLLDTACLVDGLDRNQMASRLIREGCSGYYCGRRDHAPAGQVDADPE